MRGPRAVRGALAGAALGALAGLLWAAFLALERERWWAQGLVWLALDRALATATFGLLAGAGGGLVAGLAPAGRRVLALWVALLAALGALAVPVLRALEPARYLAEHPPGERAHHAGLLVLAALALAGAWTALMRRPRALAVAAAFALLVLGARVAVPALRPRARGPHLLLITVDTLRADRLGCYGHAAASTPNVDRLAAEGVLYETVVASAPLTLPATSTLMTGLDPARHGARYNGFYRLGHESLTLAEVLADRGWETGAVIGNYALDSSFAVDQGFASYDDRMTQLMNERTAEREPRADNWWNERLQSQPAQRFADEVTDAALAWLDGRGDRPLFLWVHYMDPHKPYDPPERWRGVGADAYDGEVAFVDHEVGRLLAGWRERFPDDDTLTIFTADHGECLGEHGFEGHVREVWEPTLRVPMIVHRPGFAVAGERHTTPLAGRDVPRAIFAGLGLAAPAAFGQPPGGELRPRGEVWVAVAETFQPRVARDQPPLFALRSEDWKLVLQQGLRRELYHLVTDPGELHDRSAEFAELALEMEAELNRLLDGSEDRPLPIDDATRELMTELGYLEGGPEEDQEQP